MAIEGSGTRLPLWRRRVLPVVMALLRLMVAYLVAYAPADILLRHPAVLSHTVALPGRIAVGLTLVAGALLFCLSRTVIAGALLLAVGLGIFEWLWERAGAPHSPLYLYALALIIVLAASETLTRRIRRRIYRDLKPPPATPGPSEP
jgi:hypothetical protein